MGETSAELETPPAIAPAVDRALTGVAYGLIIVLGVVCAIVGGFLHNSFVGVNLPVVAVVWVAVLAGATYAVGWLMGAKTAALALIVPWMAVSMVFAGQRGEGDLVIAANAGGYVYLYGGFVAMVLASLLVPSRGPSWLLTSRSYGYKPG